MTHLECIRPISKSSVCDYSDAYVLIKGTIIVPNTGTAVNPNNVGFKI